ncbi:MAG: hypothetical protein QOD75_3136 [Blastocatellia bacterium]|jgi:hypothetical protein|nr:hypothetical protein [Blastocatellia bacterium]
MIVRRLVLIIASLACLCAETNAQQVEYRPILTGLVLEVTFFQGAAPAYQTVSWADAKKLNDSWYARFGKIPGWQLPAGDLPVRAVRIVPSLKDQTVTIKVSVLRGAKHDVEETVRTYQTRENEKISIDALRNFGVAPFEIIVKRVSPVAADSPKIINLTRSLDVAALDPYLSNIPGFKLTLHNVSEKNVCALTLQAFVNDKRAWISMPQGVEGQTKIEAGGFAEIPFPLAEESRKTPGGYEMTNPPNQRLLISTVVFEDESYEGDAQWAGEYLAFALGHRIELKRILPVLQAAVNANDTGTPATPDQLRNALRGLSFETTPGDFAKLFASFPQLEQKRLESAAQSSFHGVRKRLLDELQAFQESKQNGPADFKAWVLSTKERYAAWLERTTK